MTIITCPNCKGQGVEHPLDDPPCFLCNGNGMLEVKPHERVVTNAIFKRAVEEAKSEPIEEGK